MIRTRILVGLAVLIATACPLFTLAHLTYGCRYDIITRIYRVSDTGFPVLSSLLWPFGPLDWWGYMTPFACAIAVAAELRSPIRLGVLSAMLLFSVTQSVLFLSAFLPYAKLGSEMGYREPSAYPTVPFTANLALIGGSIIVAVISVARARVRESK